MANKNKPKFDRKNNFRIGEVAKLINRTPQTIRMWYEWEGRVDFPQLPELPQPTIFHVDSKNQHKYWSRQDLMKMIKFRDAIADNRGIMQPWLKSRYKKESDNAN